MKTELNIKFDTKDCKKILADLTFLKITKTNNLNPETYLFYNKIKGMCCSYEDIEK